MTNCLDCSDMSRKGYSVKLSAEMQRVVREQRLGFVATVTADGLPNVSPKGTTRLWDDEHLFFADIASPGTMRNLTPNPNVEVNVVVKASASEEQPRCTRLARSLIAVCICCGPAGLR